MITLVSAVLQGIVIHMLHVFVHVHDNIPVHNIFHSQRHTLLSNGMLPSVTPSVPRLPFRSHRVPGAPSCIKKDPSILGCAYYQKDSVRTSQNGRFMGKKFWQKKCLENIKIIISGPISTPAVSVILFGCHHVTGAAY